MVGVNDVVVLSRIAHPVAGADARSAIAVRSAKTSAPDLLTGGPPASGGASVASASSSIRPRGILEVFIYALCNSQII